ncbi:Mak16 protein [Dillenia turbinata]|uniref:Protein MAK16 homolog n=1 Tax=Dillenia turbinata TaxID=194707 RepID=A0AAN8UMS9_9MAGN
MQHDEVIWQVIRHNHCSFMAKINTGNFCRNPYNVTGIWVFYLYMKTIERAHKPNELWERIKLPRNYEKALETIDKHLMYWPKLLIHKIKQRLTKMTQMRIRMRKLALKTREKIMTMPRKETKREARREEKAEKAAVLDKSIEKELLERLKKGAYGDIYNYPVKEYNKVLDMEGLEAASEDEAEEEEETEIQFVEGYDELEEEEDMEDFGGLARNEFHTHEDDGGEHEEEEMVEVNRKRERKESALALKKLEKNGLGMKQKKKARVLVEVEDEDTTERQAEAH